MTDPVSPAGSSPPSSPTTAERAPTRSSLRTRIRIYAALGLLVVGGWLYYTIQAVLGLYDATLQTTLYTELRQRVTDAMSEVEESSDSLDRYLREGQGYDLSQHYSARNQLQASLGAIRRQALPIVIGATARRADAALEAYDQACERAVSTRPEMETGRRLEIRDNQARPAADNLRTILAQLEREFARRQDIGELQMRGSRDAATAALVILAGLILIGIVLLLSDVNRRILAPCTDAARALADLAAGRSPARLAESSNDEIGALGRHFNAASRIYAERGRALEARDIESSVNAVLVAAATVNDLAGFGTKVLGRVVEVTGVSSAVLYLADGRGDLAPAVSVGGAEAPGAAGRDEARRAMREQKPVLVSVDAQTPTVDLYDGRILPRESLHLPLLYFGEVVGVLGLGAVTPFTDRARNTLTAIAPSLAVALANASANERLAEQSRRLSEQNELLEEQRSRIARTARELQRASALKDRFLAAVSHELRTPMTVILGFTGTLLRGTQGPLTEAQREGLERVQRNARLLLGLINDVLDISKIESGKAEIRREVVSVGSLLKQVESDFTETARRKGLSLKTAVSTELDTVVSDGAKLTQVLANLVGNALKFTDRGFVEVRAEPRGRNRWALVVTDSGIGIPPEEHESIFEEFRQGETEKHRGHGGTGLGLAIVRKLVTLLGGTVSVQSASGEGSTFSAILPRELASERPAEKQLPERTTADRRVLIVDDDESVRRLLRYELEPYGLQVLEAADGTQALSMARDQKPDAIILDVVMPRVDGWSTLRALKSGESTRDIPVLVHSVVDNRPFGFALGAFEHLVKPVSGTAIVDALRRAGLVRGGPVGPEILVADDDPDIRRLLERELSSAGFQVRTARDGAEALEALSRQRPAAVVLDLIMPEPDGFEVLYRIRDDAAMRSLPVVVLTGKDLTSEDYARLNGSAERILRKGADLDRLVRDVLMSLGESAPAA
jgi:signal transduction histidine kinase/DNA-binding response OmpR family regulator